MKIIFLKEFMIYFTLLYLNYNSNRKLINYIIRIENSLYSNYLNLLKYKLNF